VIEHPTPCPPCEEQRRRAAALAQAGPAVQESQRAVRFRVWLSGFLAGGEPITGSCPLDWAIVPDDGIQGVRVEFNDGTSRLCSGDDWYGVLASPDGSWTVIHNRDDARTNHRRYPDIAWKRGRWTSDAEIQAVGVAMDQRID
jgi:hypothetical protein